MRQNVIAFLLLFCIIMKKEILLLLTDNFILNVTIYYHNNWSCETKFVLIIHPRVVSFLRYRSKKIVIKYFNYYQLVTFNIIKVLVNIIWKTIFLSINLGQVKNRPKWFFWNPDTPGFCKVKLCQFANGQDFKWDSNLEAWPFENRPSYICHQFPIWKNVR